MERYKHQKEITGVTWRMPGYALLWEPRVGKSLPIVDTVACLYREGLINAAVAIAPNGVHRAAWGGESVPESGIKDQRVLIWDSARVNTKAFTQECEAALQYEGMAWTLANIEAAASKRLFTYLSRFMSKRRCLLIVDESHRVKNPKADCTRAVVRLASLCPYRRILTGTPVTQSPFDLWSQFYIIDPSILGRLYTTFKARYGIWKQVRYGAGPLHMELDENAGDHGYQNLNELYQRIAPYSSRLTEADVRDNLPEVIHQSRAFVLSDAQRKAYRELEGELTTILDSGVEITAQQAMVNMLRLQQISRGFVGDGTVSHDIGGPKPSVQALLDVLSTVEGKTVIWAHFKSDVDLIMNELVSEFGAGSFVRYDGRTPVEDRMSALSRLKSDPACRGLVGTPASGGVGVDMSSASTIINYSHSYNYSERVQALARIKGPNQKAGSLLIVDLVGIDTIDDNCLEALKRKEGMADLLTGDNLRRSLRRKENA